ncbi:MAG: DUF4097 domain-containing protein [Gemmatimonadaceae bacterium]
MRIFSVASLFAGAIGIAAIPAAVFAQQEQGRDVTVWNWDGRVDSGHWFNLSNVNGSVTIDPSRDNSVHVRAEKFPHDDGDIRDVRFVVIQNGGDVRICALNKENDRCDEDGLHSYGDDDDRRGRRRDHNVEVRFTVQVPRGVRVGAGTVNGSMRVSGTGAEVRAGTVNGGVEVNDAGGPVKAATVNGNVRVTTSAGPVSASTVNGSISARMGNLSRDGDMKFSTVNGTITVETPPSLDANISIDTMHGGISSDFPVQLSGRFGPRHAEGVIGRGGRRISMNTVNGSVELIKIR